MTKTRLLARHRRILMKFVSDNVQSPKTQKELEKKYASAVKLITVDIDRQIPPAAMNTLVKYGVARERRHIQYADSQGNSDGFRLRGDDRLVTPGYGDHRVIKIRDTTLATIGRYDLALGRHNDAISEIVADYRALVNSARYFEDLLDKWPGVEALQDQIRSQSTAVSVLGEDTLARIKKTNIKAEAAA